MSRTDSTRIPEKMSNDRAALNALFDATIVGHVAFVGADGGPAVLPTGVVRWGDRLVVHGSTGSRWMRLASGSPAVVSITAVDGVVVARSTFESSILYRSAVIFGSFEQLTGAEKEAALDAVTERLIPGRRDEVRPSTPKELAATLVLAMPIAEWSLRISDGWPEDEADDIAGPAWAGKIDFGERPLEIQAAPDLRAGIPIPNSVTGAKAAH